LEAPRSRQSDTIVFGFQKAEREPAGPLLGGVPAFYPVSSHQEALGRFEEHSDELHEEATDAVETLQEGLFDATRRRGLAGEAPPLASYDKHAGTAYSGSSAPREGY